MHDGSGGGVGEITASGGLLQQMVWNVLIEMEDVSDQ